jgi:Tfp pilus assembly protein PilW
MKIRLSRGKRSSGTVLFDVLVGLMLSSMLVAMTSSLWLVGSRSFAVMTNYAELDAKSRNALVSRSRNLRLAPQVTSFQNSAPTKWLRVTNVVAVKQIAYTWKTTL